MDTSILPYTGTKKTIVKDHNTDDIVREVLAAHKAFAPDYDLIAKQFWKGSQLETLHYIFNYCKRNFPYKVETEERQTTRSPGAILASAKKIGVDCKHYAGWIAGILDALNRTGKNFSWKYRFASYDLFSATPEHVFIVANVGGNEYWIDPVLQTFNQRTPGYIYSFDKKVNMQRIGMTQMELDQYAVTTTQNLFFGGSSAVMPGATVTPTITPTPIVTPSPTVTPTPQVNEPAPGSPADQNSSFNKYLPLLLIAGVMLYFGTKKRRRK